MRLNQTKFDHSTAQFVQEHVHLDTIVYEELMHLMQPEYYARNFFFKAQRMNDEGYINKELERINTILKEGDLFLGCFETFTARRSRKRLYHIFAIKHVFLFYEFIFLRVIPKIKGIQRLYYLFTKGRDRLLSKAEMLGRLVSCGFEIIAHRNIGGLSYFLVKKTQEPRYDLHPSYGPLFAMPRIGKNGKIIRVYKFRTMHPYSEYLQDYVLKMNGYASSGKPAEDFRLTPWGKVLRKFWLDEIPQLWNVFKGEMKLIGVRPVSQRYYEDIPEELKKLRFAEKPGCIPPYVALNMKGDVKSVQEAEMLYLIEKQNAPLSTDMKYFSKAVTNIIFRKKRSA